jgi:hypothetical protein
VTAVSVLVEGDVLGVVVLPWFCMVWSAGVAGVVVLVSWA